MREKNRDQAFISAIEYWAKRAKLAEQSYSQIKMQVDAFVEKFVENEDVED